MASRCSGSVTGTDLAVPERPDRTVTAFSFSCDGPDFMARVREAGADSFLQLPAEPYAIQAALTAAFDEFVRHTFTPRLERESDPPKSRRPASLGA